MTDYSQAIRGMSVTKQMVAAAQAAARGATPPFTCFEEWGMSDAEMKAAIKAALMATLPPRKKHRAALARKETP